MTLVVFSKIVGFLLAVAVVSVDGGITLQPFIHINTELTTEMTAPSPHSERYITFDFNNLPVAILAA